MPLKFAFVLLLQKLKKAILDFEGDQNKPMIAHIFSCACSYHMHLLFIVMSCIICTRCNVALIFFELFLFLSSYKQKKYSKIMTPTPAIISPTPSPHQSVDDTIIPDAATSSKIVAHCNSPGTILRIVRHQRDQGNWNLP